jgi:flavin reductase (DIM6/NTAB) family NADH-FMN oxidoreductase RutF
VDSAFVSLNPKELNVSQVYNILVDAIQPRPIAFVSTVSSDGKLNLAPFSFFMLGGANPPSLMYSPVLNDRQEKKDSLKNVEQTGEFVINTITREMSHAMNATGHLPIGDHDKWAIAGLTPQDSEIVQPPRVLESPLQFECRLFRVIQHGNGVASACYVIGEVIRIHVREDLWDGYGVNPKLFRPISRIGGPQYLDTNSLELFSMEHPTGKPKPS